MFIEFLIFGLCPWCECVGSIEWVAVWVVWMSATYSVSFVTANKPHWFLPLSLFTVTRLKTRPDPTVCDEVWTRLWQMEPLKHGSGPGPAARSSCPLYSEHRRGDGQFGLLEAAKLDILNIRTIRSIKRTSAHVLSEFWCRCDTTAPFLTSDLNILWIYKQVIFEKLK